jgi:hypothetical protein
LSQNSRWRGLKPRIYFLLFFLWAAFLLVFSFYSPSWLPLNPDLPYPDKYKHVIGAFVLALLFRKSYPGFKIRYALLLWILFSAGFEALQQMITQGRREFDWLDVGANILGFTLGIIFIVLVLQPVTGFRSHAKPKTG